MTKRKASVGTLNACEQITIARNLLRTETRKNLVKSLPWFRRAAKLGNPEHQMEAGLTMYWSGLSRKITTEGFSWLSVAAKGGIVGAQYLVAAELATGTTVRRNLKKAVRWYRRAAKAGHSEAQYNLALMYFSGEGTRKNIGRYRSWLELSARQGDILALRRLSEAYEGGALGYPKNRKRAQYWAVRYDRAKRGSKPASKHLSQLKKSVPNGEAKKQ